MAWKRKPFADSSSQFSSGSKSSGGYRGGGRYSKRGKYNGGSRWKGQSGDRYRPGGQGQQEQGTPTPASGSRGFKYKRGGNRFQRAVQDSPDWPSSSPEEDGEPEDEEFEEELRKKRVLCLHAPNGGGIAAAFYDPETRRLAVVEDTRDTRNWDLAALIMEQVEPTDVVLSTKAPDALVQLVEEYCEETKSCTTSLHPSKFFGLPSATTQLASLQIPGTNTPFVDTRNCSPNTAVGTQEEYDYAPGDAGMGRIRLNLVKLGCWVNVDAPATVCATGALLNYLAKKIPTGGGVLDVTSIESMALEQNMLINNDALTSLGIFDPEAKASAINRRSKDTISLFGMLNSCVTPLGKRLLHTWFLRPLMDLKQIAERHNAVAAFAEPANSYLLVELSKAMSKIKNVPRICTSLRRGRQGFADWRGLVEALQAAEEVKTTAMMIANSTGAKLPVVQRVERTVDVEIFDLYERIVQTVSQLRAPLIEIDWDASKDAREERRVCIRVGIDPELDKMKAQYADHSAVLTKVGSHIASELPQNCNFRELAVIYLPQFGHLIQVAFQPGNDEVPEDWHRNWTIVDNMYYSNKQTDDLNTHFGDMYNTMVDRERIHVQKLVDAVRVAEPVVLEAMDAIAELDCIQAFARAVSAYQLVRPIMTNEPILKIHHGRHLLQERVVTESRYVPNDTLLGGGQESGHASMMIVTGANGSGKSAYGKQVALIAYMAQIGCFVPAAKAEIGICDKIFTRVQTRESVSRMGSAFMIDLGQVSHALRGATDRSLIILDEFGKGTIPSDGAGLLAGVIKYLIETVSPRAVVLTHFHDLFTQQFLSSDLPILFCHMKTIAQEGHTHLAYLFKLSPTINLHSYAAECALAHGVPHHVVERARYVTQCITNFEIHKITDPHISNEEKAELKASEWLVRRFLEWQIDDEADDALAKLQDMLEEAEAVEEKENADLEQEARENQGWSSSQPMTPVSETWVKQELEEEEEGRLMEPEYAYEGGEGPRSSMEVGSSEWPASEE